MDKHSSLVERARNSGYKPAREPEPRQPSRTRTVPQQQTTPRRRRRSVVRKFFDEFVDDLTKALPMRAIFYHHLFFAFIAVQLPRLHFSVCDDAIWAIGWGVMAVITLGAFLYSLIFEGILWGLFSCSLYVVIAYVSTPQFFSCWHYLYDDTVHRWLMFGVLVTLFVTKVVLATARYCLKYCGDQAVSDELDPLTGDINKIYDDIAP